MNETIHLEATQLTPYLKKLFILLAFATLFEGFDTMLVSLALPYLADEFKHTAEGVGWGLSIISVGTIIAFIPIRLADWYGRRPILLISIVAYSSLTLLSAFAQSFHQFVILQLFARMFMVTEIAVACIVLSEEMPARMRGRAIAWIMACGAGLAGMAAGIAFKSTIETTLGWRAMYLMGSILLPFIPIYYKYIKETKRWETEQKSLRSKKNILEELIYTKALFMNRALALRTFSGSYIWFTTNIWTGTAVFWFSYYVIKEHDWTSDMLGLIIPMGSFCAFIGYFFCGTMMDILGRRITAIIYFGFGGLSTVMCFTSDITWMIILFYCILMMMQGVWPLSATITAEIFPTSLRATGNAVSNNLIGRFGLIFSGIIVGTLSERMAITVGDAVAFTTIFNFLCVFIVLLLIPEGKDKVLEDIAS